MVKLKYCPQNRRYLAVCLELTKRYPKWSRAKIEAEATIITLGIKKP